MSERMYFKGLDGLRCFGMLVITIAHVEWMKIRFGYDNYFWFFKHPALGNISVTLFFALSGFLITYHLLLEKKKKGRIALGNFYSKRIRRIGPLYYLIVALTFGVLIHISFFAPPPAMADWRPQRVPLLLMYVFHVPNIYFLFERLPFVAHTWSVGAELQFYLVWPVILNLSNPRRGILISLFCFLLIKATLGLLPHLVATGSSLAFVNRFLYLSRFETFMAGGAAAALLVFKQNKMLRCIYNREVQWMTIGLFSLLLFVDDWLRGYDQFVYAVLFSIILLNVAANPASLVKFNFKPLLYLGKISYGVYIFHPLIIFSILKYYSASHFEAAIPLLDNILITLGSVLLSVTIAHLSYQYYERRFRSYELSHSYKR